jgi:peroxiredoxin Q/BCP
MSRGTLSVGDPAPDFELPATGGATIRLSNLRPRPVVVVFYPGDDTPVCTRQLNSYSEGLSQFEALDAQVIGISAQDLDSHEAFSVKHGLGFPLLADVDKVVAAEWGTLGPLGFSRRSVFIIDGTGVVRYAHRAMAGLTYRPVDELIAALAALN